MNTLKLICYCIALLMFEPFLFSYCDQKFKWSSKYYAKMKTLSCIGNPEFVTNISCKLTPINWEHTVANMDVDIVVPLRNVSIRLETFKFTNQYRPFLVNLTLNGCELIKKRKSNGYIKAVMNTVLKYTNVNHTCPYSGHAFASQIYPDYNCVPFNIPAGMYKLAFSLFEGWPFVYLGSITVAISVEEKRISTELFGNYRYPA